MVPCSASIERKSAAAGITTASAARNADPLRPPRPGGVSTMTASHSSFAPASAAAKRSRRLPSPWAAVSSEASRGSAGTIPSRSSVAPLGRSTRWYDRAVKATLERERKLTAPPGFLLPHLPGEPLAARELSSTYHDTPGLRLAAAGITLRHRVERGRGAWQLKLPHG